MDAHRVRYVVSFRGSTDELVVHAFEATEELDRPYGLSLHLDAGHEAVDSAELLGRDATLRIERDDYHRVFHGIVSRVTIVEHSQRGQLGKIEIVPALCALQFAQDTVIFQEKSAVEIVEAVLSRGLAKYDRAFDSADHHECSVAWVGTLATCGLHWGW